MVIEEMKLGDLQIGDRFIIPIPSGAVLRETFYIEGEWDAELRGWHPDGVAMLAFPNSDGRAFLTGAEKDTEVLVWS